MKGLKQLRRYPWTGPDDPNKYWGRQPRKRCAQCGRRIRGRHHAAGHH